MIGAPDIYKRTLYISVTNDSYRSRSRIYLFDQLVNPINVQAKKKIILNMQIYRKVQSHVKNANNNNNQIKIHFQISAKPKPNKVHIIFSHFPKTRKSKNKHPIVNKTLNLIDMSLII